MMISPVKKMIITKFTEQQGLGVQVKTQSKFYLYFNHNKNIFVATPTFTDVN